jgi:hypothetical protein
VDANPLWPAPGPAGRCKECVWRWLGGKGTPVDRCRRLGNERVDPRWPACPAFTARLDCADCGACCREAYHAVEVGRRDPYVRLHPDRVVEEDGRLVVKRAGPRCGCLTGEIGTFACVTYADRPKTCRDFPMGGQSCVEARRRVGLTP